MRRSVGITLIELLVTITIAAILGSLAVPSFTTFIQDARRTNAVNGFFHAIFLARSESIKRGTVVSICKSADGSTCAPRTSAWTSGWIVFVNNDRDDPPQREPDEPILAVYQDAWPDGSITSNRVAYSFRPYTQAVVNGTIVFCDSRGSEYARAIIISHVGRPRIAKRDASGKPLQCAVA
jgi:type IV fimbrial biogenesis protein FimT